MVFRSVMSMMKSTLKIGVFVQVFAILLFANGIEGSAPAVKDFGPYDLVWNKVDSCPDFRTMPSFKISLKLFHEPNEKAKLAVNYTTNEIVHVDKMKLRILNNEKERRVLWGYSIDKPCTHFVMGHYLHNIINNDRCIVQKASKSIEVSLDVGNSSLFGESFFYGTYILRASLHERKKNVLCVTLSFSCVKKV